MRSLVSWLLLLSAACSGAPAATPQAFQPSEVSELGALPLGYRAGETLQASCSSVRGHAFENEALDNVDCNTARLSRVLRALAGEASARFIVGKRCHARGGGERTQLTCSARLAHAGERVALAPRAASDLGPAPSPEQVLDLDEPRPQDAEQIRVGFAPVEPGPSAGLLPRGYDQVAETSLASVGRGVLGQVSARCAGCESSALRHALRVAAGRVGAGEVTAVKCFRDDGAARCIATALVPWSS
jgi:hypothetical protein